MLHADWLIWWFIGLIVLAVVGMLLFQISSNSRLRRRRRKNHSRIVSKSRQPAVRLSVRPPKDQ
jgi:hypothetical protein